MNEKDTAVLFDATYRKFVVMESFYKAYRQAKRTYDAGVRGEAFERDMANDKRMAEAYTIEYDTLRRLCDDLGLLEAYYAYEMEKRYPIATEEAA